MRPPLPFKVACALARVAIEHDPTITDGEWIERVKDLLIRRGYDYPEHYEDLTRAIRAVERVVHRPPPPESQPHPKVRERHDPDRGLSKAEASRVYQDIERRWKERKR